MKQYYINYITIIIIITFLGNNFAYSQPSTSLKSQISTLKSNFRLDIYIPESYGTIERSIVYGKSPMVILLRDAHCNYEAQYNLVNILKHLSIEARQKEPLLVAVEGASGPMDLTQFSEFPDKNAKEKALDEFVRKGYVTGPQFLKIVEKENIPLEIYGVETPQLYTENYRAFCSVLDRKESLAYIEKLSGIAKKLKQKHYSQELLDLDENATAYRNNELNLTDWVKYLGRNRKSVTPYRFLRKQNVGAGNFSFVLQSIELESQIDFKQVEEERTRLIKLLEKFLVKEDLKELVSQSLLFRLGKLSAEEYYSYLEERIDVPERYPWLLKYIQLVQIQGKIDSQELFKELEQIEFQIKEGLFRNETERKLDKISYNLHLLSKLYRLEFTNSEWDYYREHINEFDLNKIASILKSQVPSLKPQGPPKDKPDGQASMPAEDFYKTALERDNALVDNTLRLMEDKNHFLAVLITGGFHTDGIAQRLKEKKISHIIISPKISKVQEDSPYLAIMLDPRMANPLEFSREIKSQIWQRLKDYAKGDLLSEELSSGEVELIKNAIQTTDLQLARELLLKLLPVWERSFVLGGEASANFSVQKNLAVPDLVSAGNPLLGDIGPDSASIGKLRDWEGNIITQHIIGKIVRRGDKRYLELYDRRKSHTKPLMRIRCRKEHIKEEMIEDLSVALSSVRIPTGSIEYKYINAIIEYISDSDRRFYVLEEDIDSFYGFANASIFCLFRPFLSLSPAFFHEGGEGFFLSRAYRHFLEQELGHELTAREWVKYKGKARIMVDREEVLITAHTYLRGLGKKARAGTRPLTEDEQLLPEGKGLEDWLFGPENLSVSQMISEQKEITRMLESAEEEEWVQKVLPELRRHRKFFPYGSNREVIAFLKDLIQVSSVSKLLDLCMNQLLRPSTDNPNLGLNLFDCLEEVGKLLELLKERIPYAKPQKDVGLLMQLIAKMKGGYKDVKGKGVVSKNLEPWKQNISVMKGLVRLFNRIEKAELHHHLDGAISPELILKILCLFPEARKEFVRNVLEEKEEDINRVFADKIGGPKETRDWDILESALQYLFTAREENRENREQSFIEIFGGVREYKKAVEKIRRYLVYEPESAGTLNIVEFLRKFTLTGIVLYSNPEALRIVAREATLETYRSDNVTLVEQKIHNLTNGTPLGTIVRKVLQGLREAEAISKGKIRTGLVVSIFKNPDIVLGGKERYAEVVRTAKRDERSIEEIKAAILEDVRNMLEEDYRDDMQLVEMYFKEEERELEEALMQICSPADLLVFYEVRKAGIRQVREIIDVKKDLSANYPELGRRLIGIDTVGSEIGHTAWAHSYSLRLAKKHGFRAADHAGESWPEEDIWQALYRIKGAIETGAVERIGHATALGIHPEALRESVWSDGHSKGKPIYSLDEIREIEKLQRTILKMAKDKGIVIETNPSSNYLLMPKYITTYSRHPIRYFWKRLRDSLVISSDDPHILGTIGIRGELARVWLAHPKFKFGELLQIVKNGFEHSFIPKQEETPASKDGAIGKGSCLAEKDSVGVKKLDDAKRAMVRNAIDEIKTKVAEAEALGRLAGDDLDRAKQIIDRLEEYFAGGDIVWFDALVKNSEDYLLAFHRQKDDVISLMNEFFQPDFPIPLYLYMAEVLFHEGYTSLFGEPDYDAHSSIYMGIQRKIFGEENPLKGLLRKFIEHRCTNGRWSDEINGILYVREALQREKPLLYRQYLNVGELDEDEKELLRDEFYKIRSSYFSVWGLRAAMDQEWAPYFNGSYIDALIKSLPSLELEPLGFGLRWDTEEEGIRSVHYVIKRERPLLYRQYLNIESLSGETKKALREEFYKITMAHFRAWGMEGAMNRKAAPYFNGSYIDVLIKSFPKLELEPLGFGLRWDTEDDGVRSVHYVIKREKPLLYERYLRFDDLDERGRDALKKEFLEITKAHLQVWGLNGATARKSAPYFNGSYMYAITISFPKLGLMPSDFVKYRRANLQKRFSWKSQIEGKENVRMVIENEKPDLFSAYSNLDRLDEDERGLLREEFYKIKEAHFGVWGLRGALNLRSAPYFEGSYIVALIKSFPGLRLNPLGFEFRWGSREERVESIHYAIKKHRPLLYRQYSNIAGLTEDEIELLREEFYKIKVGHFDIWGLGKATKSSCFGSHIAALIECFPELGLNPLGFKLKWTSQEEGIESVRYIIKKERPLLYQRYLEIWSMGDREKELLREEFYGISAGHFKIWGLAKALSRKKVPYFNGSYITALMKSFPSLGLDREWFLAKGRKSSRADAIGKGSCLAEKDEVPTYKLWEEYYKLTALAIDRLKRKLSSCTSLTDPEREIADHVIKRLEEYFARGDIVWFRSLVETKEDYLLAFHDTRYDQEKKSNRDQIAVMEELFRSNHLLAEHLEEVLFHEGYAAEFGEPDYQAHQRIYGKVDSEAGIDYSASSIQRKIFGENLLGPALREDYIDYIADGQNDYEVNFDERTRRNQKIRDNLGNIEKLLKDKKFVYDAIGRGSIDFSIPIEKINVYEGGQGSQKQTLHVEVFTQGDGTPRTWRFALKVAINKAAREGFAKSKLSKKEEIKEIDTLEKISGKCKVPGFGCYVANRPNNFYAYTETWIEGPTVHQLMARGKLTTRRLSNMVAAYLSVMKALDVKKVKSEYSGVTYLHVGDVVKENDADIRYLGIRDVQPENVMFMAWPPREIASHVIGEKPEDKAVCVDIGKIEYVKPLFILQEFDRHYGKSKGTEEEQERWRKETHKAIFDGVLSSLGKTAGRHFLEEAFNTTRRDRRQLKGYSRKEADLLADSLREYLEVLCIQEIAEKIKGVINRLSLSVLQNLAKLKQNPEDTSILQNILQDIKGVREEIFITALVRAEKLHEADSSEVNKLELTILSMFINSLDSVSGGNLKQLLDALSSGITSRQDSDSILDILINILQISFLLESVTETRKNIRFIEQPDGSKRIDLLSNMPERVDIGVAWPSHSYSSDEVLDSLEVGEDDVYLSLGGGPGIMNIGACLRGVRKSIYLDVSGYNIPFVVGLKANYAWIERSPGLSTNIKRQANLKAKKILEWIERLKRGAGKEPPIIVPPLQIIQADAEEIPLPDNSVSKISILDLLHHIQGQGGYSKVFKVIRNVLRIVKPGGLLLIRPNTPGYGDFWKSYMLAIAVLMGIELRFEGTTPIGAMLFRVGSKKDLTETIDGPEDTARDEEERIDDADAIGKGSCLAEKDSVGVKKLDDAKRAMVRNAIDEIKTKIAEAVASGRLAGDDLDRAKQIIDRLEEYFAGGDIVWFDALVKNPEDYLLAFYREKDYVISLMNEFFQPDFPIPLYSYMAEVLFHEGYTSLFGEPDYDAHRSIYLGIQRKVFGEENPLKELLRKFIEHRCSKGKWSDEINGILYVREALHREKPLLYRQYLRIEELDEDEKELLREEFYKIGSGHFLAWGLKTASVKEWAPYFNGSHITALIKSFPSLGLNPLGFSFCWDTEENGIKSVHYAVRKERPLLYRQYLNIENLSEPAKRALRKEFYKIIMAHFKVWELQGAMDRRVAPYFNGSYITALIKSFPELGLEPLGFGLKWDTEQDGIGSVRYIISKEKPLLYDKYLRIDNLLEDDVERLRKEFLEITKAHFMVWGLGSAMVRTTAPYFGGSYRQALIKSFPKLGLRREDFETYRRSRFQKRFRWRGVIEGVENIKMVIEQERPDLFNRYSRLDQLSEDGIELLREDFYKIKHGHFGLWGLNGALKLTNAPYFEGSHAVALIKSFPGLCLNPLGFELKWRNKKEGIESIRYVIRRERPLLYRQYSNISNLTEDEKELLREEFYKITSGHFDLWGLRKARKPQHFGSHITALIESFPSLDLNPLGFELKWGSLQGGIESVRYIVKKERPLLYRRYLDLENFGERERRLIKEEFYKITAAYFSIWGLDTAIERRLAPYFNGSHIDALIKSFPSLGLEKEGFLDKEDRVYIKKRGEEFKVTNFADRGEFFRRAGREFERKVGGYMVSGDVDHLNKLNKVYGKPIMTHILIEIRETILARLNEISEEKKLKGILFHASADEFLVYLPGMLKVNDVEDILNRVRRRVEEVLTGKYAVAEVNVDELTVDQLSKLRGSVSVIDYKERRGGNLVLIPLQDGEEPKAALDRINSSLDKNALSFNWFDHGETFNNGYLWVPTVSIGAVPAEAVRVENLPPEMDFLMYLINRAEDSLQEAKKTRNTVCVGLYRQHIHMGGGGAYLNQHAEMMLAQIGDRVSIPPDERDGLIPFFYKEEAFRRRVDNDVKEGRSGTLIQIEPFYGGSIIEEKTKGLTEEERTELYRGSPLGIGLRGVNELCGHLAGDAAIRALALAIILNELAEDWQMVIEIDEDSSMHIEQGIPTDRFVDRFKIWVVKKDGSYVSKHEAAQFIDRVQEVANAILDQLKITGMQISVAPGGVNVTGELFERVDDTSLVTRGADVYITEKGNIVKAYTPEVDRRAVELHERTAQEKVRILRQVKDKEFMDLYNRLQESVSNLGWKLLSEEELRLLFLGERQTAYPTLIDAFRADGVITGQEVELAKVMAGIVAEATEGMGLKKEERLRMAELLTILGISESETGFSKEFIREYRRRLREKGYEDKVSEMIGLLEEMRDSLKPNPGTGELMPLDLYYYLYIAELEELLGMDIFSAIRESYFRKQAYKILKLVGLDNKQVLEAVLNWYHGEPLPNNVRQILRRSAYMDTSVGVHNLLEFFIRQMKLLEYSMQFFRDVKHFHKGAGAPETRSRVHEAARIINLNGKLVNLAESGDLVVKRYDNVMAVYDDNGDEVMSFDLDLLDTWMNGSALFSRLVVPQNTQTRLGDVIDLADKVLAESGKVQVPEDAFSKKPSGVIAQDIDDVFSINGLTALNGKIRVEFSDLSPGLKSWLEGLRRSIKGLDTSGLKFAYIGNGLDEIVQVDGLIVTKRDIIKQLIKDYSDIDPDSIYFVSDIEEIEEENIVYLGSKLDTDRLREKRIKFVIKNDTGLPIELSWCLIMLGLKVYNDDGSLSEEVISVYTQFVDILVHAELIDGSIAQEIIGEVRRTGCIKLPAVRRIKEILEELRRYKLYIDVAA